MIDTKRLIELLCRPFHRAVWWLLQGKQRAIETALEEMSQRVAALEQEKEHLQTALESATCTMQVAHARPQDGL